MRAFAGQHSDVVAINRTRPQKEAQLAQLREQLASMKPTVAASMRESIVKRIADLEKELGAPSASNHRV
ncbi:50S ribosomal protein L29 [Azospirillaceae bacterium]